MLDTSWAIDPRDVLKLLSRRKWYVLIPVLLVTGVAVAATNLMAPKYGSFVVLRLGNPVKLSSDLRRMLGDFGEAVRPGSPARHDLRDYKRQIASPAYVSEIVDRLELDKDPSLTSLADGLSASQPDMSRRDLLILLTGQRLADDVELEFVSSSHLKLTAQANEPYAARDLAQTVGEVFVAQQASEEMRTIFMSLDFSFEQLARYEKALQDKLDEKTAIEKDIAKWQSGDRITTVQNRTNISSEIERRTQELGDLRSELFSLQTRLERLAVGRAAVREPVSLEQRKSRLKDMVGSFETLVQDYAWDDPAITNLQLRVVRMEDEIEAEHRRLVDDQYASVAAEERQYIMHTVNTEFRISALQSYVDALKSGLALLERKRSSLPELQTQLERVTREVRVAESLRDRFRDQQESFRISQSLVEESQYQIIESARVNLSPVWPDQRLILAAGILAGLLIGGAAVLVAEFSDRSLKDVASAEAYLGLPVIGVVPRLASTGKRMSGVSPAKRQAPPRAPLGKETSSSRT